MKLTEDLISSIAKEVLGTTKVKFQDTEIDLMPPWPRMTMHAAVKKYLGVDVENKSLKELREIAERNGLKLAEYVEEGMVVEQLFGLIENKIVQPTFIINHPVEISPLAKTSKDDPRVTERFELFICGHEYANAYSEENNPIEQKRKFEEQQKLRKEGDKEAHPMDEDFIRALEFAMPPTSGLGIGLDRLVMLLTNSGSIRDVIMFPILRE
jgi:lysyl-tRNA synthetase class 2